VGDSPDVHHGCSSRTLALGALIALAVAFFGAAWMWLSLGARSRRSDHLLGGAACSIASMLAARCVGTCSTPAVGVRQAVRLTAAGAPSCACARCAGAMRAAPLHGASPRVTWSRRPSGQLRQSDVPFSCGDVAGGRVKSSPRKADG
jgi:hypothetical protein